MGLTLFMGCSRSPENTLTGEVGLAAAWQETRYLNFKKAKRLFETARLSAKKDSKAWVESTLGLAICLHHTQPDVRADKEQARTLYDELIVTCSDPEILPQILLLRARLADQIDFTGDQVDEGKAFALYQRLQTEFPETRQANETVLYRAHLLTSTGNEDAAKGSIAEIENWIEDHPDNPLVALQWELVARLYMVPLDKPAAAVSAFLKAEKAGLPPMSQRDAFYWRLACLAERAGDQDTAARYFERIILEEHRSGYGYESQVRLKAMGKIPPPLTDPFTYAIAPPREVSP